MTNEELKEHNYTNCNYEGLEDITYWQYFNVLEQPMEDLTNYTDVEEYTKLLFAESTEKVKI